MESEQVPEITIEELKSVERYLWVLIDSYPSPVNQAEIASRTKVSRSAVTRIRDTLIKFCDLKSLAWERKLILKNDIETRMILLAGFLWSGNVSDLKTYLGSHYFVEMVLDVDLFSKITESYPQYAFDRYFSKEDITWLKKICIDKMLNYQPEMDDDVFIGFNIEQEDTVQQIVMQNLPQNFIFILNGLFDKSFTFLKEETDFIKLLELRDKIHLFLRENEEVYSGLLGDFVEWIDEESDRNQKVEESTKILFLAISKKFLKLFTEHVYKESSIVDIQLDHKYKKIGSAFKK